jgi:hypothetical protein
MQANQQMTWAIMAGPICEYETCGKTSQHKIATRHITTAATV